MFPYAFILLRQLRYNTMSYIIVDTTDINYNIVV